MLPTKSDSEKFVFDYFLGNTRKSCKPNECVDQMSLNLTSALTEWLDQISYISFMHQLGRTVELST